MSDRGYKVIHKYRTTSESTSTDDQLSPQTSRTRRGDYYPDDREYGYPSRRQTDGYQARERRSGSTVGGNRDYDMSRNDRSEVMKTTYDVGRTRNDDAYVKGANVIVLDQPRRRRGESEPEWEVIQPERNADGAYVIEMGGEEGRRGGGGAGRGRQYEYDVEVAGRGRGQGFLEVGGRGRDVEHMSRPDRGRDVDVLAIPVRRDRSMSRGMVEAMKQVQVTEDYSDDDRRSRVSARGGVRTSKATVATSIGRTRSAVRHDHSPSSDVTRRRRSCHFNDTDVRGHDASECRHERPGTEAALAGSYLVGHKGEYVRRGDDDDTVVSGVSRRRTEGHDRYGEEVERRREKGYYRDERYGQDNYERQSVYEEQKPPRRKHRHHHKKLDDDDARSSYSDYYEKKIKEYR